MDNLIKTINWGIDNEALRFKVGKCLEKATCELKVYAEHKAKFAKAVKDGDMEMAQVVNDILVAQGNTICGYLSCLEEFIPCEFQFYIADGTIFLQAGLRTIWSYNFK